MAELNPLIDAGPPRLDQLWASAIDRLTGAGIDDAALEAEVLLRHALGGDRAAFLAMQREPVPDRTAVEFERLLATPDWEVYAWIIGNKPVPPNYAGPVLDQLLGFRYDARAL